MGGPVFLSSCSSSPARLIAVSTGALLGLGLSLVALAAPAAAAPLTFTVNTAGAQVGTAGDGRCDALVAAGDQCTFREALTESNANQGRDTIAFDTAAFATAYRVTQTAAGFPTITDPVTIDGTTQPGYNPSTGAIVRVDGANLGLDGLTVDAGGGTSIIKGLVMTRFSSAVVLKGDGNQVSGSFFGVTSTGATTGTANSNGVLIDGGNDNVIGGLTTADRNVIGQNGHGVYVRGSDPSGEPTTGNADGNGILGNYIGVRSDGTSAQPNSTGVYLDRAVRTAVGSSSSGNLISGNSSWGVYGYQSPGTDIAGNRIGTNPAGASAVPNYYGVGFDYPADVAIRDNLISGNSQYGVYSYSAEVGEVTLSDNTIGLNAARDAVLPNAYGVYVTDYSQSSGRLTLTNNAIGGNDVHGAYAWGMRVNASGNMLGTPNLSASLGNRGSGLVIEAGRGGTIANNVISGNGEWYGSAGLELRSESHDFTVSGNRIGTNSDGTLDVGNNYTGLLLCGANDVTVGGADPLDANVISGNGGNGIEIACNSTENLVQGNLIGRALNGITALGNDGHGVYVGDSDRNLIGGSTTEGNVIASNGNNGVGLDYRSAGIDISANAIVDNGTLGIDLNSDGVTSNDFGDGDAGSNARQNYPVLTQAGSDGSVSVFKGNLDSRPNRAYRLEFFANTACDPSGHGEGQRYLGSAQVSTDASGSAVFNKTLSSTTVGAGEFVSATATDLRREDTSEFSGCVEAVGLPTATITDVTTTEGDSGTTNAVFTVNLSAPAAVPASVRAATTAGTATAGSDFNAVNVVLNFAVGETSKTITVPVRGDLNDEFDETYTVELTEADSLTISDASGLGTIVDNDPEVTLSVANLSFDEPASGASNATAVVRLSRMSGKPVTFTYATASGTANSLDYTGKTASVTVPAGATSRNVSVPVKADAVDEPDETFFINFTNVVNATFASPQATVTIIDTDPTPTISLSDASILEGNSGNKTMTFTATLSSKSAFTVTADYASADETATQPSDYLAKTGVVTFTPGITSRTITVTVKGDAIPEPDETLLLNLSNAIHADLSDDQGQGTIVNDD